MKTQEHLIKIDGSSIRIRLNPLSQGRYLATSPDVPGLVAEASTPFEAIELADGLARKVVESCREHGDPLPLKLRMPTPTQED